MYSIPYLGDIKIYKQGGQLFFTFGEIYQGELPHVNNNTFFREPIAPMFCRTQFRGPLRFNLSIEGAVESLTIDTDTFTKRVV